MPHEHAHDSTFTTAVFSSLAVNGGLVAKRATGQEGQPRQAIGPGPCPPPAQPLRTGSVVTATTILSYAGANVSKAAKTVGIGSRKFRQASSVVVILRIGRQATGERTLNSEVRSTIAHIYETCQDCKYEL